MTVVVTGNQAQFTAPVTRSAPPTALYEGRFEDFEDFDDVPDRKFGRGHLGGSSVGARHRHNAPGEEPVGFLGGGRDREWLAYLQWIKTEGERIFPDILPRHSNQLLHSGYTSRDMVAHTPDKDLLYSVHHFGGRIRLGARGLAAIRTVLPYQGGTAHVTTPDMAPFDESLSCPKCGRAGADAEYYRAASYPGRKDTPHGEIPERLVCACPRCKYDWLMRCKDAPAPATSAATEGGL